MTTLVNVSLVFLGIVIACVTFIVVAAIQRARRKEALARMMEGGLKEASKKYKAGLGGAIKTEKVRHGENIIAVLRQDDDDSKKVIIDNGSSLSGKRRL